MIFCCTSHYGNANLRAKKSPPLLRQSARPFLLKSVTLLLFLYFRIWILVPSKCKYKLIRISKTIFLPIGYFINNFFFSKNYVLLHAFSSFCFVVFLRFLKFEKNEREISNEP